MSFMQADLKGAYYRNSKTGSLMRSLPDRGAPRSRTWTTERLCQLSESSRHW
jgi:hypothetical protein